MTLNMTTHKHRPNTAVHNRTTLLLTWQLELIGIAQQRTHPRLQHHTRDPISRGAIEPNWPHATRIEPITNQVQKAQADSGIP